MCFSWFSAERWFLIWVTFIGRVQSDLLSTQNSNCLIFTRRMRLDVFFSFFLFFPAIRIVNFAAVGGEAIIGTSLDVPPLVLGVDLSLTKNKFVILETAIMLSVNKNKSICEAKIHLKV